MASTKIRFYPKSHKYKIKRKTLTSVTTFIGKFFEKFDAKKIARKLAKFPVNKKKKQGVRYFLKTWKEAAEHGTRVHEYIEKYIKDYVTLVPKIDKDMKKLFANLEPLILN